MFTYPVSYIIWKLNLFTIWTCDFTTQVTQFVHGHFVIVMLTALIMIFAEVILRRNSNEI